MIPEADYLKAESVEPKLIAPEALVSPTTNKISPRLSMSVQLIFLVILKNLPDFRHENKLTLSIILSITNLYQIFDVWRFMKSFCKPLF